MNYVEREREVFCRLAAAGHLDPGGRELSAAQPREANDDNHGLWEGADNGDDGDAAADSPQASALPAAARLPACVAAAADAAFVVA